MSIKKGVFLVYLLLFLVLISTKGQTNNKPDAVLTLYFFLHYDATYKFLVSNNVYTYENMCKGLVVLKIEYMDRIYRSKTIHIKAKPKDARRWSSCEITLRHFNDSTIIIFQDSIYKEACFKAVYPDSEGFEELMQIANDNLNKNDTLFRKFYVQEYDGKW